MAERRTEQALVFNVADRSVCLRRERSHAYLVQLCLFGGDLAGRFASDDGESTLSRLYHGIELYERRSS